MRYSIAHSILKVKTFFTRDETLVCANSAYKHETEVKGFRIDTRKSRLSRAFQKEELTFIKYLHNFMDNTQHVSNRIRPSEGDAIMRNRYQTHSILIVILSLLVTVLVGCASNKPSWGDPETGYILTYRIPAGQMYTYISTSDQSQIMEMMGRSMETETDIRLEYSVKGAGYDDQNNLLTEIAVDSIDMVMQSPRGERKPDLSSFTGKRFGLTLSTLGDELAFPGADTIEVEMGGMGGTRSIKTFFRNPFPDLTDKPVKIGDAWTSQEEETVPMGPISITLSSESSHVLEGTDTIDGIECLRIRSESTGMLEGTGDQMGNQIFFEGDLESTTTWYFAYKKGIFVQSTAEMFMEGTTAVTGQQNMTIPMTQEIQVHIRLAP
jgi:hypothetical protein